MKNKTISCQESNTFLFFPRFVATHCCDSIFTKFKLMMFTTVIKYKYSSPEISYSLYVSPNCIEV